MRSRFDQFAKQMARQGLAPAGVVETDAEVSPDARRIDVWFTPNPDPRTILEPLGMLGRIALVACTLEPFHQSPDGEQVMGCVCKHFHFRELLARREPAPPLPNQWIISSGRPSAAIPGLRFEPSTTWGPGVYEGPPLTYTSLIAVSELPETRDTLLVRLMGAGKVLSKAVAELGALPEDAPERVLAMPVLLRLRFEVPADPAQRSQDDQEFVMSTQDMEFWTQRFRQEGRDEGLKEGRDEGLKEGRIEARAETLLDLYEARFGAPPADIVALVRRTRDLAVLRSWIRAIGTGSAAEVATMFRAAMGSS